MKTYTATELLGLPLPPIHHIVESLFEEEAIIFIAGTPGSFKTGFMLFTALCLATKEEIFGFPIKKPLTTLFIDEENGLRRTKHKLRRMMSTMGIERCDRVHFACFSGFRLHKDLIRDLESVIKKTGANVIVMDSFIRVFLGDERNEKDVRQVHDLLKPLVEKYKVTIFILHHLRKQDIKVIRPHTLDDIRGSSDIGGQCDQAFILNRCGITNDDTKTFECIPVKEKDGLEGKGFNFIVKGKPESDELRVVFGGFIADNIEKAYEKTREDIINLMSDGKKRNTNDIIRAVKHKKSTVVKTLNGLVAKKVFECNDDGKGKAKWYWLSLSGTAAKGRE